MSYPDWLNPKDIAYCQPQLDQGWTVVRVNSNIFSNNNGIALYERTVEDFGPRVCDDYNGLWEYPTVGCIMFKNYRDAVLFKLRS